MTLKEIKQKLYDSYEGVSQNNQSKVMRILDIIEGIERKDMDTVTHGIETLLDYEIEFD